MFKEPSFEDAVKLFKQWGFQVEPGPRPEQVTLILEGPDYRTYSVYEAHMLPQIASVALRVRWQNGSLALRAWQGKTGSSVDFETLPFPGGAASSLRD
jgi:hypothetical protein